MSAIRNTITLALANHLGEDVDSIDANYDKYVSAVEEALLEREWAIAEELKAIALRETGYSEENLDEMFDQVGLTQRPVVVPETSPELPDEDIDPEAPVTRAEFLELSAAVRRLTSLAERHLGSAV